MLLYVFGIVVVLLGIAISIALHEIGHLVPAKRFGVRVGQYMVGFGPTLFSRTRGETEYGIKAIPLGGYISMAGMYPPTKPGAGAEKGMFKAMIQEARSASDDSILEGHEDRVFYKLPIYKRIIIMLGGPVMNLLIAIVLFAIVLSGIGIMKETTTIQSVSECVLPATSTRQVCRAGDTPTPANTAGLMPGDTILSFNDTPVSTWKQESAIITRSAGTPLVMQVLRAGKTIELTATPIETVRFSYDDRGVQIKDAQGKPVLRTVGFLGVGPAASLQRQPISTVLPAVGTTIAADVALIANLPNKMIGVAEAAFGPAKRDPSSPMSIVGAGRIAGEVSAATSAPFLARFSTLLGILASLNVALFAFNLVPLLPLDGGHVAGALWEGIRKTFAKVFRRKDPGPVDAAKLVPLTYGVVILLIAMTLLLIYADIVKPIVF